MRIIKNSFNTIEWNKWQTKNREEEIRKSINKLAPPWVKIRKERYEGILKVRNNQDPMDRLFIIEELERAFNSVRVKSAPGRDQIDYNMIKKLNQKFKEELLTLFN